MKTLWPFYPKLKPLKLVLFVIFCAFHLQASNATNFRPGDRWNTCLCLEFRVSMATLTGTKLNCDKVDLGVDKNVDKLKFTRAFWRNRSTSSLSSPGHSNRVTSPSVESNVNTSSVKTNVKQDLASDQQYINPAFDHLNNYPMNEFTLNPLNSLFPLYTSPFVQPLKPEFFNFFPPKMSPANQINNNPAIISFLDFMRKSHLPHQNVTGMPSSQGVQSDPSYLSPRSSDVQMSAFPKVFTFSDERVNLEDFEKAKKSGKMPPIYSGPMMHMAPRDSYLMLHGGNFLR